MKTTLTLLTLLVLTFSGMANAKKLHCSMTDTDATPWLIFSIDLGDKSVAMSYQSFPFFGAEIFPLTRKYEGCQHRNTRVTYDRRTAELYFECAGDGDAGYAVLKRKGWGKNKKYVGYINFPNSGPAGYGDEVDLHVVCR